MRQRGNKYRNVKARSKVCLPSLRVSASGTNNVVKEKFCHSDSKALNERSHWTRHLPVLFPVNKAGNSSPIFQCLWHAGCTQMLMLLWPSKASLFERKLIPKQDLFNCGKHMVPSLQYQGWEAGNLAEASKWGCMGLQENEQCWTGAECKSFGQAALFLPLLLKNFLCDFCAKTPEV